eukprot:g67070.t1
MRRFGGCLAGVVYLLLWFLSGLAKSTLNKAALKRFPFPMTVLYLQYSVVALLLVILLGATGRLVKLPWTGRLQLRALPYTSLLLLGHLCSQLALQDMPVYMLKAIKSTEPLVTLLVAYFWLDERCGRYAFLSLFPVVGGAVLTCLDQLQSAHGSTLWLASAAAVLSSVAYDASKVAAKSMFEARGPDMPAGHGAAGDAQPLHDPRDSAEETTSEEEQLVGVGPGRLQQGKPVANFPRSPHRPAISTVRRADSPVRRPLLASTEQPSPELPVDSADWPGPTAPATDQVGEAATTAATAAALDPLELGLLANVQALLLLLPLWLWRESGDLTPPGKTGWLLLAGNGLADFVDSLSGLFFLTVVSATSAAVASNLRTVFIIVVSMAIFHDQFTPLRIAGVAVVLFGALILRALQARMSEKESAKYLLKKIEPYATGNICLPWSEHHMAIRKFSSQNLSPGPRQKAGEKLRPVC